LISCLPFPVFKYLAEPSCSALFHGPLLFFNFIYKRNRNNRRKLKLFFFNNCKCAGVSDLHSIWRTYMEQATH
jgi:hypothetical protein